MILVLESELTGLAEIERKEGGVFGGKKGKNVQRAVGIWIRKVGIEMVLKEIGIYRRSMKMALQFIAVYSSPDPPDNGCYPFFPCSVVFVCAVLSFVFVFGEGC